MGRSSWIRCAAGGLVDVVCKDTLSFVDDQHSRRVIVADPDILVRLYVKFIKTKPPREFILPLRNEQTRYEYKNS